MGGAPPATREDTRHCIVNSWGETGGGVCCYSSRPEVRGNVVAADAPGMGGGAGGAILLDPNALPVDNTIADNSTWRMGGPAAGHRRQAKAIRVGVLDRERWLATAEQSGRRRQARQRGGARAGRPDALL